MLTSYQAKYFAYLLSSKSIGGNIESLSQSLLSATVDINPHQIDAALFAFKSPLSKGVVLADEVGLGKTIEAGLVMCQYWALGQRKMIVVCPAALRKQWSVELNDKFGIDNIILDTKVYNDRYKSGKNPFPKNKVVICSYNFASRYKTEILLNSFQLAVVDEAHKLRNVYRPSAKTAKSVKDALDNSKKLLLTATPFQNSLLELYGLTSVIDEKIFGSEKTFKKEYGTGQANAELRDRIAPLYKRTLRNDVREYINYTNRHPLTQKFSSTDDEYELYMEISNFLRRDDIYSVPTQQKKLITMIIRKILASSTYALISTLTKVKTRLEEMLETQKTQVINYTDWEDEDFVDFEDMDMVAEESEDDDNEVDIVKLKKEIALLESFIQKAKGIKVDSKAKALLTALETSFEMQKDNGAPQKALIFTESTKTQDFLKEYLEQNGYEGRLVLFNGKATDPFITQIYKDWCDANPAKVSGIKAVDRRMAIVDYFRNSADVMIATEAAAEGLNLQFCSLVVNYDLPWNPQRIEQRIGRCHRYGQKHDVVVVNFVNVRNYADVRVFDLLEQKFNLFDDIFGASDEVLGQAEAIDFEDRIYQIYQQCRTEEEIKKAFDKLQEDMKVEINERMQSVRQEVLENFDINVQERLRMSKNATGAFLNRYEYIFWELTKYVLKDYATFNDEQHSFMLQKSIAGAPCGKYDLASRVKDGAPYRLSTPLAQYVIEVGLKIDTQREGALLFDETMAGINVQLPPHLQNQQGFLMLSRLNVSTFDDEQHCLFTAFTQDGYFLTQEECEKLFLCATVDTEGLFITKDVRQQLNENAEQHMKSKIMEIDSRNLTYFNEEENRILRWEKDVIDGLENDIDVAKKKIIEIEHQAQLATNLQERLSLEKQAEKLRKEKSKKRRDLEDKEDEVSQRRKTLIAELEKKMIQETQTDSVFILSWQTK